MCFLPRSGILNKRCMRRAQEMTHAWHKTVSEAPVFRFLPSQKHGILTRTTDFLPPKGGFHGVSGPEGKERFHVHMSGPRHISAREWRKPSNADGSTGSRDLDFRVLVSVMPRCQRPKHTKVEKSRADICANQAGELWVLCTVVQASCGGRMGGSVFSRFVQEGSSWRTSLQVEPASSARASFFVYRS